MLMEGSTLREGRHADRLRRAVDWFLDNTRPSGQLGNPKNQIEAQRYMYGHGYGMLFLASIYGEEEDGDRRKKLEETLTKAVEFSGRQTPRAVTATSPRRTAMTSPRAPSPSRGRKLSRPPVTPGSSFQVGHRQGDQVPQRPDAHGLHLPDGSVGYHPGRRAITPGLTTAGIACLFSAG